MTQTLRSAESLKMASKKIGLKVGLPNTHKDWSRVKEGLQKIAEKHAVGLDAFERILELNDRWEIVHPPFKALRRVLSEGNHVTEEHFCETLLPWIAKKALQVEVLFKDVDFELPKFSKHTSGEITFTRQQVCCLLALAFLNTYDEPGATYQQLTLVGFYLMDFLGSQRSKLVCILKYFERIMAAETADNQEFLSMCITIERRVMLKDISWEKSDKPLCSFESLPVGLIEDADGCLQVDFANAYIGGGVLQFGNVQEEIRFVINPECLVSMLLCQEMENNEAILIRGAERFSTYTGYGGRFTYTGPYEDTNPLDSMNRRCVSIVAIDAIPFSFGDRFQHGKQDISRELNKAYCGFSSTISTDDLASGTMAPIATGNWGCGAFGGDKELKTLIQWMAASQAGRSVKYYTFKDPKLTQSQQAVVKCLLDNKVTVGQLFHILTTTKISKGTVFTKVMNDTRLENNQQYVET